MSSSSSMTALEIAAIHWRISSTPGRKMRIPAGTAREEVIYLTSVEIN